ncbi:hypothetical protein POKO110462_02325 [Pontibacter korlensis]
MLAPFKPYLLQLEALPHLESFAALFVQAKFFLPVVLDPHLSMRPI